MTTHTALRTPGSLGGRRSRAKQTSVADIYPRIWRTVERIPKGRVASYGAIARLSGLPGQPRLAGYALFNLPEGIDIPWQRVINARGEISLPGKRGDEQRRLLEAEGVVFKGKRVDMSRFGWNGGKKRKLKAG